MAIDKTALDLLLAPDTPEPARPIALHGAAIRMDAARRMDEARAALLTDADRRTLRDNRTAFIDALAGERF